MGIEGKPGRLKGIAWGVKGNFWGIKGNTWGIKGNRWGGKSKPLGSVDNILEELLVTSGEVRVDVGNQARQLSIW